jgi:hypothetical protein
MASDPDSALSVAISRRAIRRALIAAGVVVVLIAIALVIAALVRSTSTSDALASEVNANDYQAVFLSNSEVYFGKLTVPSGSFCFLQHVYRLTSVPSAKRGQPTRLQLVKLVNDIHNPLDKLIINRAQILYVENLNPSGSAAHLLQQGRP